MIRSETKHDVGPGDWIFGHSKGCDICEEVVFPGFQY